LAKARLMKLFAFLDGNSNGVISREELFAFFSKIGNFGLEAVRFMIEIWSFAAQDYFSSVVPRALDFYQRWRRENYGANVGAIDRDEFIVMLGEAGTWIPRFLANDTSTPAKQIAAPATIQRSAAPATVQRSAAPATVQRSAAPATVQRSAAPATVGSSERYKEVLQAIRAEVGVDASSEGFRFDENACKKAWLYFDQDKSNTLTPDEVVLLGEMMWRAFYPELPLDQTGKTLLSQELFKMTDTDGSGDISYSEFVVFYKALQQKYWRDKSKASTSKAPPAMKKSSAAAAPAKKAAAPAAAPTRQSSNILGMMAAVEIKPVSAVTKPQAKIKLTADTVFFNLEVEYGKSISSIDPKTFSTKSEQEIASKLGLPATSVIFQEVKVFDAESLIVCCAVVSDEGYKGLDKLEKKMRETYPKDKWTLGKAA